MEEKEILDEMTQAPAEASAQEEVVQATAPEQTAPVESEDAAASKEGEESDEKPMSKKKKILNAILLGAQILLVVVAIIITLIVVINPKSDEVSSAGIKLLPVLSGSMDGTWTDADGVEHKGFAAGALVISKNAKDKENLQVGDIVTFASIVNGQSELVTHRIIEVKREDGYVQYITKGDANPLPDSAKLPGDIQAVYMTHIDKLGWALWWIRDGYHFIYIIIIPLGVLLLYNIYLVAQIVVEGKMKKARAAAAENAKQQALASIDEEEIKRRAIEEYLKSQAAATEKPDASGDGENE